MKPKVISNLLELAFLGAQGRVRLPRAQPHEFSQMYLNWEQNKKTARANKRARRRAKSLEREGASK